MSAKEIEELRAEVDRLRSIIAELGQIQDRSAARDLRLIAWVQQREPWIDQVRMAYVDGGDLFKAVDELVTFDLANPPPKAK